MNTVNELMVRMGVEQKELAAAIGVSQPTVSDWKRNKKDPKGDNLKKVADFFGVTPQVVKGLYPIPGTAPGPSDDDADLWELREQYRRREGMRILFNTARQCTDQELKQAAALVDALRATNTKYYDGDDAP